MSIVKSKKVEITVNIFLTPIGDCGIFEGMNDKKQSIITDWKNGLTPFEISKKYEVSRSYVYQLIGSAKENEVNRPMPSPVVLEKYEKEKDALKSRIEELEEENKNLRNDVRRLTDKLLSLI